MSGRYIAAIHRFHAGGRKANNVQGSYTTMGRRECTERSDSEGGNLELPMATDRKDGQLAGGVGKLREALPVDEHDREDRRYADVGQFAGGISEILANVCLSLSFSLV